MVIEWRTRPSLSNLAPIRQTGALAPMTAKCQAARQMIPGWWPHPAAQTAITRLFREITALGYDSLDAWAGVANLEERVDGNEAIDPVVLTALREETT